ncbi:YveK family protein [Sutcliffiella rhizosphaerae]|uniref:Capsular polysaccharide biosynthesis protein YwqC n=1 Tax=Sutcliffiella rhizosphaerae TaxID=2880967 RepID=A0ABM8YLP3_9BACI|nr:Wzz/FepE/Etk N-terminal domain-containing protein [Sutcliffiella rhizosphaerae]CAG9620730.1 putative capsular polysaccharide biosynthesis protein YwqC [Sutcliffiella rhizosphaerae]
MDSSSTKEIEIGKIIKLLIKKSWILLIIVIITTATSAIYQHFTKPTPLYQTSASLLIQDSASIINTLQVFIKEPPVMEGVIQELKLERTIEGLANQISVQPVQDSQIVRINVIDTDPNRSADIANTTAVVFKKEVAKTLDFQSIEILYPAVVKVNQEPINPESNRMIQIGVVLGFIIGIGFIFLLDSLDNKIRSERELEILLELPVLGTVSKYKRRTFINGKEKKSDTYVRGDISESKTI